MANIQFSELNPAGSELFIDAETFVQDLTDTDAMVVQGGVGGDINKLLEFGMGAYAINNVISLAKSFSAGPTQRPTNGGGGTDEDEDEGGGGAGRPGAAGAPGFSGVVGPGLPGLPGPGLLR